MANLRHVSAGKWKEAKKALLGFGFDKPSSLTAYEQESIKSFMRGPFTNGMSEQDANRMLLNGMGWVLSTPDKP